jgi:hypothetical protein
MTSAILIALVGFIYFAVAIDQALIQHNFWNGVVWLRRGPDRPVARHRATVNLWRSTKL